LFRLFIFCSLLFLLLLQAAPAQESFRLNKFTFDSSGLELTRSAGSEFFDVVGRRSAVFGYENKSFEAWAYPLKLVDDVHLRFQVRGNPQEYSDSDLVRKITVRPECTTLTYSHAAFTVRAHFVAPLDKPGIIILLDIQSVQPLTIRLSFIPTLKLMWPAASMTPNTRWDSSQNAYLITEESQRFAAMIGSPLARENSLLRYQDDNRNQLSEFVIEPRLDQTRNQFVPVIIAGGPSQGSVEAIRVYQDLLTNAALYAQESAAYYKRLLTSTLNIKTPDEHLNSAYEWAKVAVDKGFAVNPFLGPGLLAGFRNSGANERPGFAWFFGRDSEWTSLAINSYGDFEKTKDALRLLKKYQRSDGKIMHELSQSAAFVDWFKGFPYGYASADSTPLFILAVADYYSVSGDLIFLREMWDSVRLAYQYAASTDTDGDGLIENTRVGHGWVEGGTLYPVHEEIYLAGLWAQSCRAMSSIAEAMNDLKLQVQANAASLRAKDQIEKVFWQESAGIYAFGIKQDRSMIDEVTVMPTVPMWWRILDDSHAHRMLERIASANISTDWGTRILSNQSQKYDPLSYHNGSVWPLFSGWASLGAYNYGRAHLGFAALKSNAELTYQDALGSVTELLSGDFNQSFTSSTPHQVWSSAMVITPLVRGLLGLAADAPTHRIGFAPQLPADWNQVEITNFRLGDDLIDFKLRRGTNSMSIEVNRRGTDTPIDIDLAPSFPVDAEILRASIDGKPAKFAVKPLGDSNQAQVRTTITKHALVEINYQPGTEIIPPVVTPEVGARTHGLKVLSTLWTNGRLMLDVEGLAGETYDIDIVSPRALVKVENATVITDGKKVKLRFAPPRGDPNAQTYVRRVISVELARPVKTQEQDK